MRYEIVFSPAEVELYYEARGPRLRVVAERRGPCPIHRNNYEDLTVEAEAGNREVAQ